MPKVEDLLKYKLVRLLLVRFLGVFFSHLASSRFSSQILRNSSNKNLLFYFSSNPNASTCCFNSSNVISCFSLTLQLYKTKIANPGRAPNMRKNSESVLFAPK